MTDHYDAGWYSAPDRPGQQRYWDGHQWTDTYAPQAPSHAPFAEQGFAGVPQNRPGSAPQRSGAGRLLLPIGIGLAVLVAAAVIGTVIMSDDDRDGVSAAATSTTTTTEPRRATLPERSATTSTRPADEVFAQGESATTGDLEVTINTVEDPYRPTNDYDKPPAGQRFIGIQMTLVNQGDETVAFSTYSGVEVIDAEGQAWEVAYTSSTKPKIEGDVPAGATRKGWVYVSVGAEMEDLQLRVKGGYDETAVLFTLE